MDRTNTLEAGLLRRYDQPGPRYTSYPTAPQFHERFTSLDLQRQAHASNGDPIPRSLSLYVHVPYCFSPCFYCGCNRVITRDPARGEQYVEWLLREIELVGPLFDRDREVVQLHFGGGTPNFLDPDQLGRIVEGLASAFRFSRDAQRDFSIEIDPRVIRPGDIARLAAVGFTRASLGVQDFDPQVQQAIHREQSVEQTLSVLADCRVSGLRSVNVDLIYGLPKQTPEGFARTLETVLTARPDRLAIYGYAHLPQKFRAQRQIPAETLPDADARVRLLRLAIETLTAAGYRHIGMDHFALPGDDLALARDRGDLQRNFMGYTTHAQTDLIGFGVSAISQVGTCFSQNRRDVASWQAALEKGELPLWRGLEMSRDDLIRADVIQQLMCRGEIDVDQITQRHHLDFASYFDAELTRLQVLVRDGLVMWAPGYLRVSPRGRLLIRNVAMCFDRYLQQPVVGFGSVSPEFSKSV